MLDKLTSALAVLLVVLAALAADQRTQTLYWRGPSPRGADDTTERALGRVVGIREPVAHAQGLVDPARGNPARGENRERSQLVAFEILTGTHRGRLVVAENVLHFRPSANAILRQGSLAELVIQAPGGRLGEILITKPIVRFPAVLRAVAGFLLLLVLVAGLKGIRIAVSVLVCGGATVWVLAPALLCGYPPVLCVLAFALVLMGLTFVLVGQVNRKGLSAALGAMGGLVSGLLLALAVSRALRLTGLASTEALFLQERLPEGRQLSFADLLVAGSVIAVLGIVIDVAISIASGIEKLFQQSPRTTRGQAFRSGMRMAGDIMGATLLTLVFAFLGLNIHVLLLPQALPVSLQELVNSEAFCTEVLRILCGSIGLLLTGPLTAFTAAWLLSAGKAQEPQPAHSRKWRLGIVGIEVVLLLFLALSLAKSALATACWPKSPERRLLRETARMPDEQLLAAAEQWVKDGRLDQAVITLWEAERRDPANGTVSRELAYTYALRRWFVVAEKEIDEALKTLDKDSRAHYVAGVVKAWVGKHDEGEQHLRHAVELDPANEVAAEALEEMFGEGTPQAP